MLTGDTGKAVLALRRAADYGALEESHRSAVRHAADLLDAVGSREEAGLSALGALLALFADPAGFKEKRNALAADVKELRAATAAHAKAAKTAAEERAAAAKALADAERKLAEGQAQITVIAREAQQVEQARQKLERRRAEVDAQEARVKEMQRAADATLEKIAALRAAINAN
jgi:chromosome segregation ATPase